LWKTKTGLPGNTTSSCSPGMSRCALVARDRKPLGEAGCRSWSSDPTPATWGSLESWFRAFFRPAVRRFARRKRWLLGVFAASILLRIRRHLRRHHFLLSEIRLKVSPSVLPQQLLSPTIFLPDYLLVQIAYVKVLVLQPERCPPQRARLKPQKIPARAGSLDMSKVNVLYATHRSTSRRRAQNQ
jgi:hypothetical protein